MITAKQQEVLDSIENEDRREHYRAQFEMQNELGTETKAGGIFDAPVAGFFEAEGYDNSRNVLLQMEEVPKMVPAPPPEPPSLVVEQASARHGVLVAALVALVVVAVAFAIWWLS